MKLGVNVAKVAVLFGIFFASFATFSQAQLDPKISVYCSNFSKLTVKEPNDRIGDVDLFLEKNGHKYSLVGKSPNLTLLAQQEVFSITNSLVSRGLTLPSEKIRSATSYSFFSMAPGSVQGNVEIIQSNNGIAMLKTNGAEIFVGTKSICAK